MRKEVAAKTSAVTTELQERILDYLQSSSPGGQKVIDTFMAEFEKLAERSPRDDPTNLRNHMDELRGHLEQTWDESIGFDEDGNLDIGIGKDEYLGFKEDKARLKHSPDPMLWVVYLIRGIAGQYAFVNPTTYLKKKGKPMPAQYHGGFLISKWSWELEGWDRVVGPFEQYEHPASGAPPYPFFKNVIRNVDMQSLIDEAIKGIEDGNIT